MRFRFLILFYAVHLLFGHSQELQGKENNQTNNKSPHLSKSIKGVNTSVILSQAFSYYYQGKDKLAIKYFTQYLALHGKSGIALRCLGVLYLRVNNLKKAISYLELSIKAQPNDQNSLQILAQIYINLGKLEKAKSFYEKILKINPLEINSLEILAEIHQKQKNVHKSIAYYKKLLIASKNQFSLEKTYQALQALGNHYYSQEEYAKAIPYYEKLHALDKKNISIIYALSYLYKLQGSINKSTKQYIKLLKLKPKHKISCYEIINNYFITNNPKARMEAKRFMNNFSKVPDLIKGIYAELIGNTEKAKYQFRLVLKKQANTLSAHIGMAKIYDKLNDHNNLKKEFFLIIYLANIQKNFSISRKYAILLLKLLDKEAEKNNFIQTILQPVKTNSIKNLKNEIKGLATNYIDVYSAHAFTMEELDENQNAIVYYNKSLSYLKLLKKVIKQDKVLWKKILIKEYALLTNIGWLLHEAPIHRYLQSIQSLEEGMRLFPKEPKAHFLAGVVRYYQGEQNKKYYKLAIKYLQKAIQLLPKNKVPGSYFFYLGASMEKTNNFKDAEKLLKKAIDLEPQNFSYMNYLAYIYSLKGIKYSEASKLLFRALEDEPENEAYLDSLGWLFYKNGKYSQALEKLLMAIEQAKKKNKVDAVIYFHIAETYSKLKKYTLASNYFHKTLKNKKSASEKIDEIYIKEKLKSFKKIKKP